jgi:hypothetical protein
MLKFFRMSAPLFAGLKWKDYLDQYTGIGRIRRAINIIKQFPSLGSEVVPYLHV